MEAAFDAEARTAVRSHGLGNGVAPLVRLGAERRSTEPEHSHQRQVRGGESDEKKNTAKFRKTPPPQPEFFQLYEEEPGGVRPGSVFDPVP